MRARVPLFLVAWALACGGGDPAISLLDPGGRPDEDAGLDGFVTPDGATDVLRDGIGPQDPGGKPDNPPPQDVPGSDQPGVIDVPGDDVPGGDVPDPADAWVPTDYGPDGCRPRCDGRNCGDDGCGGQCGPDCTGGQRCDDGVCKCLPWSGMGCCGDDVCWYDTCGKNPQLDHTCVYGCLNAACKDCAPDCTGRQCGSDGCGGVCGYCEYGEACTDGRCIGGCLPDCGGRECGSDGCGGTCGTCKDTALCVVGECVSTEPCTGVPQSWGPAGLVSSLQTPGPAASAACFDYDDDGQGDNALAGVADLMNPYIQPSSTGMVFEFEGVKDFANTASFPLNVLRGTASGAGGSQVRLDPGSYDGQCHPWTTLPASIQASALSAGPGVFVLILPFGTGNLVFVLQDARFGGKVQSGGASGVALADGVLGGVLTQAELDNTMALAAEQCGGPGAPAFCTYLDMLPSLIPMEMDLNGDGVMDAAPLCFRYTLKAVRITGYL